MQSIYNVTIIIKQIMSVQSRAESVRQRESQRKAGRVGGEESPTTVGSFTRIFQPRLR